MGPIARPGCAQYEIDILNRQSTRLDETSRQSQIAEMYRGDYGSTVSRWARR